MQLSYASVGDQLAIIVQVARGMTGLPGGMYICSVGLIMYVKVMVRLTYITLI